MGGLAVLGERPRVGGYALAGALLLVADDDAAARDAWAGVLEGRPAVDVLVLTPRAARAAPAAASTRRES